MLISGHLKHDGGCYDKKKFWFLQPLNSFAFVSFSIGTPCQILREINFQGSRRSKKTLNFDFDNFMQFLRAEIFPKTKFRASEITKMVVLKTPEILKIDFT